MGSEIAQNWSIIAQEWSQTPQEHFRGISGTQDTYNKNENNQMFRLHTTCLFFLCPSTNLFCNSRHHMAAPATPEGKCPYIDHRSFICSPETFVSWQNKLSISFYEFDVNKQVLNENKTSSCGAFVDLFPEDHIGLCDGSDKILKSIQQRLSK